MHFYRIGNEFYPSVTTIISSVRPESTQIQDWKDRNGNWRTRLGEAQSVGTIIHYRILNNLSAHTLELPQLTLEVIPDDALMRAEIADSMWDGLGLDVGYPRRVESFVVNHEYRFAGKPDLFAPIDGVLTLVDLKTSKAIYESHKLQLGGYHYALGKAAERGMLISLNPDERTNPSLQAHFIIMSGQELDDYSERFLDLAKQFYEYGYDKSKFKEEYIVEDVNGAHIEKH